MQVVPELWQLDLYPNLTLVHSSQFKSLFENYCFYLVNFVKDNEV